MTMENRVNAVSGKANNFPVGLRVLVVDDDLCCLKLVENILKKCQFNVTTTSQPMEALKMLREDKDRFEIVITDVFMPVMDGFKLLDLIGLEMDIPVIMLSAYSDTKYVMKGVQHGACDYLVKPCRMLELQNIWQHVFKRKHMNQKNKNKNNNSPNQDDELALARPENLESSDDLIAGQKRKDRNHGEENENGEIETEDPARTRKKPRVDWSDELHQKFLATITHLTIEKAAPKKIVELMNIKGLTRENVASHLQKYRHYLKRIEAVKNIQETLMHVGSIEGFGLPESRIFPTIPFSSTLPELFQGNTRSLDANQHVLGTAQSERVWQQESEFPSTSYGSFETHFHHEMPLNNSRISHAYSLIDLPSMNAALQNPQPNSVVDVPCQEDMIGSVVQTMNCPYKPNGEEHKPVYGHNPNHSAVNPSPPADEIIGHNDMVSVNNPDISQLIAGSHDCMPLFAQHNEVDDPFADLNENFLNLAEDEFFPSDLDVLGDFNLDGIHELEDIPKLMDRLFWPQS